MWFCGRFATANVKGIDPCLVGEGKKCIGKDSYGVGFYSIMGWNQRF